MMRPHHSTDCAEVLMDLICYEVYRDRLTPEMETLLVAHLAECECCKKLFRNFQQIVGKKPETSAYVN
jgi:hypothetical protein